MIIINSIITAHTPNIKVAVSKFETQGVCKETTDGCHIYNSVLTSGL